MNERSRYYVQPTVDGGEKRRLVLAVGAGIAIGGIFLSSVLVLGHLTTQKYNPGEITPFPKDHDYPLDRASQPELVQDLSFAEKVRNGQLVRSSFV